MCQQYLEKIKRLTTLKLHLAGLRIKDASQKSSQEEFSNELSREETEFWDEGEQAFEQGRFLPMEYLCRLLGLDEFERHCLVMALGYEVDQHMPEGCACLHGNIGQDYITPWLAWQAWHKPLELSGLCRAVGDNTPLMGVCIKKADPDIPLIGQPLRLKERIRSFLLWNLEEDHSLNVVLTRWQENEALPPLMELQADLASMVEKRTRLVEIYGPEGSGRSFCVKTACGKWNRMAFLIHPEEAPGGCKDTETLWETIWLECLLFQAVPALLIPKEMERDEIGIWIRSLVKPLLKVSELVFIISVERLFDGSFGPLGPDIPRQEIEIRDMSLTQKREVWKRESEAYDFAEDVHVDEMANLFQFTYGKIKQALKYAAVAANSRGRTQIEKEDLRQGCYRLFEKNMVKKAVQIPACYTWEDLVLPDHQKEMILAACAQVKYKHKIYEEWGFQRKMPYGRGVSLIFAGAPGTGKTMAAQVFASELGIDLYKVELSTVVSKYVGETEKNLNEIFEQAAKTQIILFFDEADVLFSKRTEIKDANDKYSNMEAAFLLQKMETYDGVTILATNLIQNFDEAFKRRVKFVVDFPFPGPAQRKELWERAIPSDMPAEELDLDYLADSFELSGSNIRNIMLHAAFLAAPKERKVGMREILMAVKNEFAKSGKILTREDMGEYHMLLPG